MKKKDDAYVKVNFPFFFGNNDDLMMKAKTNAVDIGDLDKNQMYKLDIVFKAYEFVAKGETKKGYITSLVQENAEKENQTSG